MEFPFNDQPHSCKQHQCKQKKHPIIKEINKWYIQPNYNLFVIMKEEQKTYYTLHKGKEWSGMGRVDGPSQSVP